MKIINEFDLESKQHLPEEHMVSSKIRMNECHVVAQPLTEQDIIWLQELFLTNDIHRLQVDDLCAGRSLIHTMLYSLNYYHDIACLTLTDYILLDSQYVDVYLHLLEKGLLDSQSYDLEAFFLDQFYADFLWIEEDGELLKSSWYKQVLKILNDLQLAHHMPIVILSYK